MIALRPYQERAVGNTMVNFRYYRTGLLMSPTRSGKTVMALEIANRMGWDVVVVTPLLEIARQWIDTAERFFPGRWRPSLLGGGSRDASGTLVSCTIDSLGNYVDPMSSFNGDLNSILDMMKDYVNRPLMNTIHQDRNVLLIFDEAHRAASPTGKKILKAFRNARKLFITASPRRSDGQSLDQLGVQFIVEVKREELVSGGVLINPGVIHVPSETDWDIAEAVAEHAKGQTLVFTRTTEEARSIASILSAMKVKAAHITSKTPRKERDRLFQQYRTGKLRVLCAVRIGTEGVDLNMTQTVVLADRPKTETAEIQRVGRALGVHETDFMSKQDALIIVCDPDADPGAIRTNPDKGYVSKKEMLKNDGLYGAIRTLRRGF